MEQQGGNKGIWAGFIIALLVALLFLVLWVFRGSDIDALNRKLDAAQSQGESEKRRLESDLRDARGALESANRKVSEAEQRLTDEQRRANESAQQIERRLRIDLDAAEERLAAANRELAEARASSQKTQSESEQLRAQLADLGQRRDDADSLRKQADDLRKQLESSKERLSEANDAVSSFGQRLRESEANLEALRKELDAGKTRPAVPLAANADKELSDLRTETARLETALAGAQNANAALEELRNRLSRTMEDERKKAKEREDEFVRRQIDLQRTIDELRGRAPEAAVAAPAGNGDEANRLRAGYADAIEQRDALQSRLDESFRRHRDELDTLRRESGQRLQDLEKRLGEREKGFQVIQTRLTGEKVDLQKRLAELEKRLQADGGPELRERLTRENADLQARVDDIERQRFDLQLRASGLESEKAAWGEQEVILNALTIEKAELQSRLDGMEKDKAELIKRAKALGKRLTREKASLQTRVDELEREKAAAAPPPTPFPADPESAGRFVGRVVETMSDGQIYLIDLGSKQRVLPGMKFVVHRPDGERWRYAGTLKVIRSMENHAMAVAEKPGTAPVHICSVTGRVVLDPDATVSPYAANAQLQPANADGALPAIGDYIDNVFYDPDRSLLFALGQNLAGDESASLLVRLLGGTPCLNTGDPGRADFMVYAGTVPAERSQIERPKPATMRHMFRYWNSNSE